MSILRKKVTNNNSSNGNNNTGNNTSKLPNINSSNSNESLATSNLTGVATNQGQLTQQLAQQLAQQLNQQTNQQLPAWTTPNTLNSELTTEQLIALAQKDEVKRRPNIFWGRSYSGIGQLQHNNLFLKVVIFFILSYGFWNSYQWRLHSTEIGIKQWVVFEKNQGVSSPKDSRLYQTGADNEEIQAMAWNMVRWVIAASSSNVEASYTEARQFMTQEMLTEFDKSFGEKIEALKQLGIYRKIENASVRQMTEKDVPAGSTFRPSRYDVIVSGELYTYRESNKDLLAKGPFTYRLRLVPLNTRTIQNPSALLVNSLEEINYQSTLTKNETK
ncbi:MAG: hypothetical protein JNM06_03390 [Blastocatellia bacterium]|nr:hypothetical protein [Blastocatellia bacterium]